MKTKTSIQTTVLGFILYAAITNAQNNTYPYPSTGNIGIGTGTSAPVFAPLVIQSNSVINNTADNLRGISIERKTLLSDPRRFFIIPHASYQAYNPITSDGDFGLFWSDGASSVSQQNNTAGLVIAPWGASSGIKILSNGSVGIGASNPTFSKLVVQNPITTNNAADDLRGISIEKLTTTTTRRLFIVPHGSYHAYNDLTENNDFGLFWTDNGNSINGTSGFVIAPWAGSNAGIKILSDGKVGIGVSNPSKMNEPNCKLFVLGGILTEKIKVSTYATWADYVFSNDYKLKPLKEIESFIHKNKHLPNIPSAKEIKEHGLDLGEMQAKQMEKIEELTLYIIQQNKTIIEQNKRIEKLEKKIK